jgi:hypothetical protein
VFMAIFNLGMYPAKYFATINTCQRNNAFYAERVTQQRSRIEPASDFFKEKTNGASSKN